VVELEAENVPLATIDARMRCQILDRTSLGLVAPTKAVATDT
jgi:hypothetical protein